MQWLKNLFMALPLLLEMIKEYRSSKEAAVLPSIEKKKNEYAALRYVAIKTFDESDPVYIANMAKISQSEHLRYFLYDWKERALMAVNETPMGNTEAVALLKALTRFQLKLREYEVEAIKMGVENV